MDGRLARAGYTVKALGAVHLGEQFEDQVVYVHDKKLHFWVVELV